MLRSAGAIHSISHSFVLTVLALSFAAATAIAQTPQQTDGTSPLIQDELGHGDTTPPPPEYPYPGATQEGEKIPAPAEPEAAPLRREQPVKIDENGEYYYDTHLKPETFSNRPGAETPKKTSETGEYFYDTTEKKPDFSNRKGVERPSEIKASGEFLYREPVGPSTRSATIRFGAIQAPDLVNADTGASFFDIYTSKPLFTIMGDYEWKLTQRAGHIGLKFTSGIVSTSGRGTFLKQSAFRRADDIPIERYTLIMFPNQFTGIYHFQYSDTQFFVPYVEGGAGYFTFMELRNDNQTPKLGGAAVAVVAGGINLLLDGVDRDALRRLSDDYGIGHVWFSLEVRHIEGLNANFNFTSNIFDAGFALDF